MILLESGAMMQASIPDVPVPAYDYELVEEPNPAALRDRLTRTGRDGWEPVTLGYAGHCRLLALRRRRSESRAER